MSRQMGMGWGKSPGHGSRGDGGGELMGKGGMPLVCAQGWKESLVLSSSPEPVPKSHAPTVLYKNTERRGESSKRKCRGPCLAQTGDGHLDLDPRFQIPLSFPFLKQNSVSVTLFLLALNSRKTGGTECACFPTLPAGL